MRISLRCVHLRLLKEVDTGSAISTMANNLTVKANIMVEPIFKISKHRSQLLNLIFIFQIFLNRFFFTFSYQQP